MRSPTQPVQQEQLTLQQYVSDMLALETHIEEALDGQLRVVSDHPEATAALQRFHTMVRTQREVLRRHLNGLGGTPATGVVGTGSNLVKGAVTAALGMAAGAINQVRTQGTAKALRDDYTAFNHAAVGYAMLLTTAELLEHRPTAEIAETHLRAYEGAIEEIAGLVPDVVAWELRKDGRIFDDRNVGRAAQTLARAWRAPGAGDPAAAPAA